MQAAKADCECPIYITYTNVNGYLILTGDAFAGYHWKASYGSGQGSQRTGRGNSETVGRKRTTAGQRSRLNGMGKSC